MSNTRELRRRIKSIKNTSSVTRAMQMVAATKMRKAQNQALGGRSYSEVLLSMLGIVSGKIDPSIHPLLVPSGSEKIGILILSSDKGLCGGLNTNLFRLLQNAEIFKNKQLVFYTVGKKGRDFVVRTGKELTGDFENRERVGFYQAETIRKFLLAEFIAGNVGQVYLLYPHFMSTIKQEPKLSKILPIENLLEEVGITEEKSEENSQIIREFLFEPNPDQVMDFALTHLLDTRIYQALLETKASEHSARMVAMKNATDNAMELVGDLTLSYNQLRQENITKELLEITSAGLAME